MRAGSILAGALALAGAITIAGAGQAAVTYSFSSDFGTSFTYTSPDFIGAVRFVSPGALSSCTPLASPLLAAVCGTMSLYGDTTVFGYPTDDDDLIEFRTAYPAVPGAGLSQYYLFANGALNQVGLYSSTIGPGSATLTVTGFADPVPDPDPGPGIPEPGTWALMMLGFGGLGAAMRRRRRLAAA